MGSRLEANSNAVRKRIEQHTFEDETGEEYEASKFGGFSDYFRRKKIKLQNLDAERRRHNADNPQIFRGIVVHVNGYTQPSLNDLHAMIVDHGGGFLQYLDSKTMVTHVVAANLTLKKAEEFRKYRIVKPAWVVDSIKAGKLLPWNNYRLIEEGSQQNVLHFDKGNVRSQPSVLRSGYREQTETSWYATQVRRRAAQVDGDMEATSPNPEGTGGGDETHTLSPGIDNEPQSSIQTNATVTTSLTESFGMSGVDDADLLEFEDDLVAEAESRSEPESPFEHEDMPGETPGDEGANAGNVEETGVLSPPRVIEGVQEPEPETKDQTSEAIQEERKLTAEEHNAILLSDPKIWKSTVVNPGFLKQYYEESRLHHLSAWKAELKSKLQALAQERTSSQKARMKRPQGARRYVLHVDFDCFFAAVSLKNHPQYVDKPVAVAHGNGAGAEIASCNYAARKFGVKNGMWMKSAQELCASLKVLPYDFTAYEAASKEFYEAIMDTGGIVQSVSIDEALVDVSIACIEAGGHNGTGVEDGSMNSEQAKADEIAQTLRDAIKEKTGCVVSVGIGSNILLAKVALRKAKPAGQYHIKPDQVLDFMDELSVRDLPGVAYSIGGKLEDIGVKLVKDVRELTKEKLMNTLGPKTGEKIFEYARGIDRVEVGEQVMRKSVSAEVNWGVRFVTEQQADEFVRSLCEELHQRLVNEGVKGRQLTMKIMRRAADVSLNPPKHLGHGKCDVFNKSAILGIATNDEKILAREAISIMKGYSFPPGELRGIGVQMTKLEPLKDLTPLAGGQKRLEFQTAAAPQAPPPMEDINETGDNIETPKKPTRVMRHPAALGADEGAERLNTLGSQFVLPSQVDPMVLAELPEDIRKQLAGPAKSMKKDGKDWKQNTLQFKGGSASPSAREPGIELPSISQIDPETLEALPEDIRAELQSFYKQPTSPRATRQVRLPQTPHKSRLINHPTKRVTPTKPRGQPRGTRVQDDPHASMLQSNIVPVRPDPQDEEFSDDEIPPEVLAALPPEIREEVLAEQRNARLQSQGWLNVPTRRKMHTDMDPEVDDRVIVLPPKPAKPTFTAAGLSALPELRTTTSEWVAAMGADGPNEEDVETLVRYLERVILEERDLEKAVGVVKWLVWVVSDQDTEVQVGWLDAVHEIQDGVQAAVRKRGLGPVQFE